MWQLSQPVREIAPGEVHIWRAVCAPAAIDLSWHAALLTSHEMARASRFATETLRRRYLQAHSLLHTLLSVYAQTGQERREIGYLPGGKPYLHAPHLEPRLEFNMSHAGEMVVIAFGRGVALGVDIELVRPIDHIDALVNRICTERERIYLAAIAADKYLAAFLRLWTRKEAWLKMVGEGLRRDPATVDVCDAIPGSCLVDLPFDTSCELSHEHYVGTVALAQSATAAIPQLVICDARWQS